MLKCPSLPWHVSVSVVLEGFRLAMDAFLASSGRGPVRWAFSVCFRLLPTWFSALCVWLVLRVARLLLDMPGWFWMMP
eukprot:12104762-Karenia_brevis.AAC.1